MRGIQVEYEREIRRYVHEHEILLSFGYDDDAVEFLRAYLIRRVRVEVSTKEAYR